MTANFTEYLNKFSQQEWLDASQGMNSYVAAATEDSLALGRRSGKFLHAEAFTRHLHLGFAGPDVDPLRDTLGDRYCGRGLPRGSRDSQPRTR